MAQFDASQIIGLVSQMGGDHQAAGSLLRSVLGQGEQVDTDQHADLLHQLGIDPMQLATGALSHLR